MDVQGKRVTKNKNILILAPYELYRQGVKLALSGAGVWPRYNLYESDSLTVSFSPRRIDLIIVDSSIVTVESIPVFRQKVDEKQVSVLMLADKLDDDALHLARRIGASGITSTLFSLAELSEVTRNLLKGNSSWPDTQMLKRSERRSSLGRPLNGGSPALTERQIQVLKHVRVGRSNKQIGYDMNISESTVKSHISEILRKFAVTTRTQLVSRLNVS